MRRWFLPESPDVLGMLRAQAAVTAEGLEAFVRWARGDARAADEVRAKEHEADDRKHVVRQALTEAFSTPLDAEDLYVLSLYLDRAMNGAKDTVRECEVTGVTPDAHTAAMAERLLDGVRLLDEAFARLVPGHDGEPATAAADAAVRTRRALEKEYRAAMSSLLAVDDVREVIGRRELYRRLSRMGEDLVEVADRVWYATLKEG
jgi:uncharacterized protein Yka (UPF0111/DUF47 family)